MAAGRYGTRRLGVRDGAEILSVPRAQLRITRGPARGRTVALGEVALVRIGSDPDADLALDDDAVSRWHAELRAGPDGYVVRDLGSTNGTRVDGLRVREALLDRDRALLTVGETQLAFRYLREESEHRLSLADRFGGLSGRSSAMRRLFDALEQAAPTDATVLVTGESGSGKERVAESLHAASRRAGAPLVVLDCSALQPALVESELFGHERGAFTGAVAAHAGAFVEADGGTLFIDEVGELPLEVQPKLLRAIERREVKPLGGSRYRPVDVRIVAAAQRPLERLVAEGRFRADLYYRLAVVRVTVPPLRQRPEDLPLLAAELVAALKPGLPPEQVLTPSVLAAFAAHDWPGNVRELKNTLERLLIVGDAALPSPAAAEPPYNEARRLAIAAFERDYCRRRLAEAGGVPARAAANAGMSRQLFHHPLRKHGLATDEEA